MVRKKNKSKRLTLKQKYKIQKKVREHQRQARRDARKNPQSRQKLKKDVGLPNIWPFKEEFLERIEKQKQMIEEDKHRQKQIRDAEIAKRRGLAQLSEDAEKRSIQFEKDEAQRQHNKEASDGLIEVQKDGSRKAFYREFKRIVEMADVVLEVLDARDPLGCRCKEVEERIMAKDPNKKIILVLNKIDLIPKENLEKWLKYLRNELPTVAFKCSTQETHISQNNKISVDVANSKLFNSTQCLGADTLLQLLKNYCRNLNLKTSITVGIIGYPNVGKSSLINSLKRSKVVSVGSTPGLTKNLQEVHLDKNIKLIDCPGIVFASDRAENDIILRNAIKIEQLEDPSAPVEAILKRCQPLQLAQVYSIALFNSVNEFLMLVANKRGKLGKGGKPDLKAAARAVLKDWNEGKIPFCTTPPQRNDVISTEIVSSWGKAFDIQEIIQSEQNTVLTQLDTQSKEHMVMESSKAENTHLMEDESEEEEEEGEEMEDSVEEMEDEGSSSFRGQLGGSKKEEEEEEEEENGDAMVDEENLEELSKELAKKKNNKDPATDITKKQKKQQKKIQKKKKKQSEIYDFDEYFPEK